MKSYNKLILILMSLVLTLCTGCTYAYSDTDVENSGKITTIEQDLKDSGNVKITLASPMGEGFITDIFVMPGEKYGELPVPQCEGYTFLGWFDREYGGNRILKNQICELEKDATFYGQWMKQDQYVADSTNSIPTLMYHWFYDEDPTVDQLIEDNWMPISEFDEQMNYLSQEKYYFPSWEEMELFIDGKLSLPQKSIVITDDDGKKVFFELAIPVIKKYDIQATSFLITSKTKKKTIDKFADENVSFRSHSHNLHIRGKNSKGVAMSMTVDEISEDIRTSAEKLGHSQVFCYPFGHVNDNLKAALTQEGYTMAVTTQYGLIEPNMDKLNLPRVRMSSGMDIDAFKKMMLKFSQKEKKE